MRIVNKRYELFLITFREIESILHPVNAAVALSLKDGRGCLNMNPYKDIRKFIQSIPKML